MSNDFVTINIPKSGSDSNSYFQCFNWRFDVIENKGNILPTAFGQFIFQGQGKYDEYCVYVGISTSDGIYCSRFLDKSALAIADYLKDYYGKARVWYDVLAIFDMVRSKFDSNAIFRITDLSTRYVINPSDQQWALYLFSYLYYAMLAEENKRGKVVGKYIKLLAFHRLFNDNSPISDIAECDCGKEAPLILAEAERRHLM